MAFVVCPKLKEDATRNWTETRSMLVSSGFALKNVRRTYGVDPSVERRGYSEKDKIPTRLLSVYFVKSWVGHVQRILRKHKHISHVAWVEDDCQLLSGTTAHSLRSVASKSAKPTWAGFYPINGKGRTWGSHLVCVSLRHDLFIGGPVVS